MPYVSIPRDIMKVKSKVAFGLTKRQLICVSIGAVIGIPLYWYSRKAMGDDIAFYLLMIFMIPIGMLAFFQKNGVPFEKYIMMFVQWLYIRPRRRFYQTENLYDQIKAKIEIDEEFKKYVLLNRNRAAKKSTQKEKNKNRSKPRTDDGTKKKDCGNGQKSKKRRADSKINTADNPL